MKLAIIGGRDFADYKLLCLWASVMGNDGFGSLDIDEIISGGAAGADSLGARYAKQNGIKLTEFIPDWEKHGKRAGFLRNEDIIAAADVILGFWDGKSRGTGNSLSIAKRLKKPTMVVYY